MKRNPCVRNGPDYNGAPEGIRTSDLCLRRATVPINMRIAFLATDAGMIVKRTIEGNIADLGVVGKGGSAPVTRTPDRSPYSGANPNTIALAGVGYSDGAKSRRFHVGIRNTLALSASDRDPSACRPLPSICRQRARPPQSL